MSLLVKNRYIHYLLNDFVHIAGPLANWGIVLAGLADMRKDAKIISLPMTGALCIYSMLFMRFAWVVKPRNLLLLSCHAFNETVQLYQLKRKIEYDYFSDMKDNEVNKIMKNSDEF